MSISRRLFIQASGGAVATIAVSGVFAARWFNSKDEAKQLVRDSLHKRFPYLDLETKGVKEFETWFVNRTSDTVGVSGASVDMALDDKVQPLDFDRVVYREFALNTNFFAHNTPEFKGIEFQLMV